ncbi:RagB/SusD family nutrient uptake outer membrane protein [Arthrospiribacter ruber]|uniref:RagB/SusD family nutrient uptake outer membrane protein n=1 Tax=Arthrospiribacter ruber TaxID=2487934 RepID=A0A951MFE9_9BACT|nr:RagB/SusD family nutrient uptake outer membrane protein [Arthrospiribacter ruber]MBW3469842.1 RagB/SusD family nutrient uptake outer membrane protein [Arthrospiribacter ruber]
MKARYIFNLSLLILVFTACESFLNEKPDQALIVPRTLEELWSILDNSTQVMNQEGAHIEASADDVIILPFLYNTLSPEQKNAYIWNDEIYETPSALDWDQPFRQIFFANTVLFELENLPESEKSSPEFNRLKGSALFYRAYAYFSLSRQFCLGYDEATAGEILGLPLRSTPNITDEVQRSNLKDTFEMILKDLEEAEIMLPENTPHITRPTKIASRAMLSRVYLYMGNFEKSLEYADLTLLLKDDLLDYNNVNPAPARPFVNEFDEVIFYSELLFYTYYFFSNGSAVNPDLVELYHENDLRKQLFFFPREDHFAYRGQYSFLVRLFSGLATDEVYLTKAECHARLGQPEDALNALNTLLRNRFISGTYEPIEVDVVEDVLETILTERRKQLLLRGIRWGDLKRFNVIPGEQVTLTRDTPDGVFNLPPNDFRYAYPIPEEELQLSGIAQNPR